MRHVGSGTASGVRRVIAFVVLTPATELDFLTSQIVNREGQSRILNEAMLVLDIIDSKTSALLGYISISFAALVFILTGSPSGTLLASMFQGDNRVFTILLAVVILLLMVAMLFCLSCLNIIGAQTMRKFSATADAAKRMEQYEKFIVRLTLSRRRRYLIAHRISLLTAVVVFLAFAFLLWRMLHC